MKKTLNYEQTIKKTGFITIFWNSILSVIKFICGILSRSSSMISDAIHSISDVFSTIIVIIGTKLSSKESDNSHPYGHERFESIASLFLGIILIATASVIGYSGLTKIILVFKGYEIVRSPFVYLSILSAIFSIVVKGIMFFYTKKIAKKINSTALKADSYHHLSDSLSSIASLIGIIGLIIGNFYVILDPIASMVIAIFIIRVGIDIIIEAVNQLVDKTASVIFLEKIIDILNQNEEVKMFKNLKTRMFGTKIYVDLTVCLDKNLSFIDSFRISKNLHDTLEKEIPEIIHCMIYVEPY